MVLSSYNILTYIWYKAFYDARLLEVISFGTNTLITLISLVNIATFVHKIVCGLILKIIQEQFNHAADQLLNEQRNGLSMSVGISCASMSQPANADQLVALADAALR